MITKKHRVELTNGRVVLVVEDPDEGSVSIASEYAGDIDYYICEIRSDGVLVMPNSGDATACIVDKLDKRG